MTTRQNVLLTVSALALVSMVASCTDEYPPAREGGVISGTVFYGGQALADLDEPAILVGAFAFSPESDFPHALTILTDPDFSNGPLPYELHNLPTWDHYYVLAQVGEAGDLSSLPVSVGAYPDFCTAVQSSEGYVAVTDDAPTTGIDIAIYDGAGAQDPCFAVSGDVCPEEGSGSLVLELRTAYANDDVQPGDMLVVALFREWPSSELPDYIGLITQGIEFPYLFVGNDVEPGDYAITVCFDIGGDDVLAGGCGSEDLDAAHEQGAMVTFEAGVVVETWLDIDDESSGPITTTPAADLGCDE